MPHEVFHSPDVVMDRSLGWLAADWIERQCIRGNGPVIGEPVKHLVDDYVRFVVLTYAISEEGRLLHTSSFLSRAKGWAKSELAAFIGLFDALGPSRFDHYAEPGEKYVCPHGTGYVYYYQPGEPVGKHMATPIVQCVATEEGQAGEVYSTIYLNCSEGPLRAAFDGNAVGLTRIMIPGGGFIKPISAKGDSKDGGKATLVLADEALALDTPIPTPAGWSTMGDLKVGDYVISPSGEPVRILKATDVQHERKCYEVTFADGDKFTTSDGHMWLTQVSMSNAKPRVRTTGEMFADGRKFQVPRSLEWELPEVELDIDPYVLGSWLGDGDSMNATITSSLEDVEETQRILESRGCTTKRLKKTDRAPGIYVSLPGSHRNRHSPVRGLKVRLSEAGLLGNKHVPISYLRSSKEQRLQLLRGLMDSDGWASADRNTVSFVNSNYRLVEAVVEVARTLGELPYVGFQSDERSRVGGYWKVSWTPRRVNPFALARKAERITPTPDDRRAKWVNVESIREVESVPVRCIAVDSEDHLFLAGRSCKATHNTHLWKTNELHNLYKTLGRNLLKRRREGTFFLETSTMFGIGEGSVAEQAYESVKTIREGKFKGRISQLFDHRYGQIDAEDLDDPEKVRAALTESYAEALEWNDLESMVDTAMDLRLGADITSTFRYFFNDAWGAIDSWLASYQWNQCGSEGYDDDYIEPEPIQKGDVITLGFDGSRKRERGITDSTALIACRVRDGLVFPIEIWEQPLGWNKDYGWEAPMAEVQAKVKQAFATFRVVAFYADPAYWVDTVSGWEAKYGSSLKVKASQKHPCEYWMTGGVAKRTVATIDKAEEAILNRELKHFDDPRLTTHVLNCRRKETTAGRQLGKETPNSPKKIDAAIAMILAWQARLDAVAAGVAIQKKRVAYRLR
ncbi:terminase large subunit [Gordonia Phage JonJames]|nr:terminase large subunit [Gordonia Phage JonJames]